MLHMNEWRWSHFIRSFNGAHLLIVEPEFERRLLQHGVPHNCDFTSPNKLQEIDLTPFDRILVFSFEREQEIIDQLKAAHPKKIIASGTYEFSMVGADRKPRLLLKRREPRPANKGPVVLIATPNSDAEYTAQVMGGNDLPVPWEYIGRPFISLCELKPDIDFQRLIEVAVKRHASDEGMAYLFHTDVLEALFKHTALTLDVFAAWLREQNARLIVQRRNDKYTQAYLCGQLKSTFTRSLWNMPKRKKFTFKNNISHATHILGALDHMRRGEVMLNDIATAHDNAYEMILEDILEDVPGHVAKIAAHINEKRTDISDVLDYTSCEELTPGLSEVVSEYKRELVDRIGAGAAIL